MPVRPSPKNRDKIPHAAAAPAPAVTAAGTSRSDAFRAACAREGVAPTVRQARKYLAGRGRWA